QLAELQDNRVSNYQIIWKSEPIPHRTHLVRSKINGEAKRILREALINLAERDPIAYDVIEPVFSGGFSPASHENYQQLVELVNSFSPKENPEVDPGDPLPGDSEKVEGE
ncbi:MAG: PhnD/SsuA/transferrin family substrate-binding protein, partial [Chloroflexota bacterium]